MAIVGAATGRDGTDYGMCRWSSGTRGLVAKSGGGRDGTPGAPIRELRIHAASALWRATSLFPYSWRSTVSLVRLGRVPGLRLFYEGPIAFVCGSSGPVPAMPGGATTGLLHVAPAGVTDV